MSDLKIQRLQDLAGILDEARSAGKTIVLCHGVFDLLHVGHIRHLQAARKLGDILVVTLTRDRWVNKGPHRPAFTDQVRAEAITALECVGYVALNEWPTAVETIHLLRPDFYVKGKVKGSGPRDHTDALSNDGLSREGLVEAVLGRLEALPEDASLLLLVDAPGASPHLACRLALARQPLERRERQHGPITGVNLPLLLTALNRRETTPVDELLPLLLDRGRAGILMAD